MAKPVQKFKDGTLEVAIWANETSEGKTFYSIDLKRSYKDGEEWKETTSLNGDQALKAAHLLTKAHDAILDLRAEARS